MAAEDDRILVILDASEMTRIAVQTLRRMRMEGSGPPSFKLGGKVVYRESAVRQWIAEQEAAAEEDRQDRLQERVAG
jgi:predicted DNA-binding transcriptional regulator AlpA